MPNAFDQFDTAAATQNPFDQFGQTPQSSAGGAFGRAVATNIVPSFGAAKGAEMGAEAGAFIPGLGETGIGEIGGAIVGAIAGSLLADKGQSEAIKLAAPKAYDTLQKYQQEDLKNHPVATAVGNLAAGLPAFKFGNPVQTARGAAAIYKLATGSALTDTEKAAAKTLGTQIGAGAAGGIVAPLVQGQKPTAGEITQSIAQTLLFGTPRFGGKVPTGVPDVREPKIESEETNASREPSPTGVPELQVRPSVGEETPLRQQGETPETRQAQPPPQFGTARGSGENRPQSDVRITPTANEVLQRGYGSLEPEQVLRMPENEYQKLATARDQTGQVRWRLTQDATQWAVEHPDADVDKLQALQKKAQEQTMSAFEAGGSVMDRSQWFGDAIHALKRTEVGKRNVASLAEQQKRAGQEVSEELQKRMGGNQPPTKTPGVEQSFGAATKNSPEFSGANPDIMGVRQATREVMAKAGHPVVADVLPGTTPEEMIDSGRQILTANPNAADEAAAAFVKDGSISSQGFAATVAKMYQVLSEGQQVRSRFGDNSPEAAAYRKESFRWSRLTKQMQNKWHELGMAQQGVRDIDTGNPLELEAEFHDVTGKEFTPEQRKTATGLAKKVRDQKATVGAATEKLNAELKKHPVVDVQARETKKALDAANKVVRENAIRVAEAENQARVAEQERKTATQNVQPAAAKKALDAANKVVRRQAIEQAKKETQARVKAAKEKTRVSQVQLKAAKQALDAANAVVRRLAKQAAEDEVKNRVHPEIPVFEKVRDYLAEGETNFDEIRNKVATDLGMPLKKVTALITRGKSLKFLADDVWKKQNDLRRFKQQAKEFVREQVIPGYRRALGKIPRLLFGLKVGFHGTVALGTHAPAVAFQPNFWKTYIQNFARMYRMVGSRAYYEMQMQDLVRRPTYLTARRAGLVNDPFQVEDYNDPNISLYNKVMLAPGQRGYSVLKTLRQDMFDQHWSTLPKTAQTPEVAHEIARAINHSTGVTQTRIPGGALALFAPRLEMSRVAWMIADPLKAADTFLHWKTASEADKQFALYQAKEKAYVAGTLLSLLAFNQAMLSLTGSNQKINFDNPMQSDWLKFKAAGMDLAYGNTMLTMARLPARLYQIRESNGGRLRNLIYPDEDTYTALGEYARSQLSPFASLASSLLFKSDWQRRPLPNSSSPVPKRLAAQGVKPYTWPEFWAEQIAPIPFEEAMREVWQSGFGSSPDQIAAARKAIATLAVMSATGARLTDDTQANSGGQYIWKLPTTPPATTNVLSE